MPFQGLYLPHLDWEDSGLPGDPHHGVTVAETGDVLSPEHVAAQRAPGTLPITWLRHVLARLTINVDCNLQLCELGHHTNAKWLCCCSVSDSTFGPHLVVIETM